jgi:beta-glucanase (GH16 family)
MFRFSFMAAATALLATQVAAQTSSECNPTKGDTCPDNPALGTTFDYTFNDTLAEMDSRYFNVTAGASLITFDKDGAAFAIRKHKDSVLVKTGFYIFYGRVEAILQAAPGQGIISSMNLLSDDLDEIDWELLGGKHDTASTNWYGKGDRNQSNGFDPALENAVGEFHNYTLVWTEEELQFWLDDEKVRTVDAGTGEPGTYPQTPCQINLSLWAGGDPENEQGVIDWAGGETDYDAG